MSLREKATSMNSGNGISFMEGREKGDVKLLNGHTVTVVDYDFLTGDDGDYLVFVIAEDISKFYFGSTVITDNFKKFNEDDKIEIMTDGVILRLTDKKNKKGNRTYQAVEFYPETPDETDDIPF